MTDLPQVLQFGQHADPGPRDSNQDTVLSIELPDGRRLVAVADGMGGLVEGERAGKTALAALYRSLSQKNDLLTGVTDANAAVFQDSSGLASGTTVVAALIDGCHAVIVNVGDSRAYSCDSLGLLQVTRDHTMGEEAVRHGTSQGTHLAPDRWAGALSRYLGAKETVQADTFGPLLLEEGDWLLLCSDGLHKVLDKEDIETQLKQAADPGRAAVDLVQMALARATDDNVSVALVYRPKVDDGYVSAHDPDHRFAFSDPPEIDSESSAHRSRGPESGEEWIRQGAGWLEQGAAGSGENRPPPGSAPPSEAASVWDPGTIFVRSPRNGGGQKGLLWAAVVTVGLIGLLIAGFMALNRIMSP